VLKNIDRRDGEVYVFAQENDDPLRLAISVALATERPLLLRGDPGVGKSSVAAFIARDRHWRYYEHEITARTEVTDLLWTFDAVRKLGDATLLPRRGPGAKLDDHDYVEPRQLWWAFNKDSAEKRGADRIARRPAKEPLADINEKRLDEGAVVLVDEIDKADPDVPNALLIPLGSRQFQVAETGDTIRQVTPHVLVVITTNEERELPPAFLRRCVPYVVPHPEADHLKRIAAAHAKSRERPLSDADLSLIAEIAAMTESLQKPAKELRIRPPGIAEFLDAVWAALDLGITTQDDRWQYVRRMTLAKDERLP
jgi:MoxR-like ATPase